jgi:hypothetical protein
VPGFATGSYWGLRPANLPPAVIDELRADFGAILAGPEARKLFESNSLDAPWWPGSGSGRTCRAG